eukprot:COSAG01_NODE_31843_length_590_cov_2.232179_1_plen_172_part_10
MPLLPAAWRWPAACHGATSLLSMSAPAPLPSYEQTTECDVRALVACGFDADDARRALADAEGAVGRPVDEAAVMLLSAAAAAAGRGMSAAPPPLPHGRWRALWPSSRRAALLLLLLSSSTYEADSRLRAPAYEADDPPLARILRASEDAALNNVLPSTALSAARPSGCLIFL